MKLMRSLAVLLTVALLLSLGAPGVLAEGQTSIVDLKTQGRVDPIGVDTQQPAFSWRMESDTVGAAQTSYRIVVTEEQGTVVWDSGTVESAASVGILYEGEPLQSASAYSWTVTVTDQNGGEIVSAPAHFETSLLDDSFDAWEGAQWIGAGELSLDAASKSVFQISADVTIPEGSDSASFIFGADDFRLQHAVFNPWLSERQSYIRVELDYSDVTADGGAKINFYRVGYLEEDTPLVPFAVIENSDELNALLTSENRYEPHHVDLYCPANGLTVSFDGTVLNANKIVLNPLGESGVNTYPMLGSVGFAANPGESAVYTDYTIANAGKFARGTLLDEERGATYAIFDGLDGLSVDGSSVAVTGGENGVLAYADPSFSAAPMLRRGFTLKGEVAKARLYITAQGVYDYYINGSEIAADEWFNPGSTEYDSILAYNVYDVTENLVAGENAMGAVLGEGWWTGMTTFEATNNNYYGDQSALMAMLVVTYADGTDETIVTDAENWECFTDGPVRLASFFQGERYDATKEAAVKGWTEAGFAGEWGSASVVETRKQFRNPRLVTRYDEPVHVIRTSAAVEYLGETKEGSGSYLYDMGENVSGVPLITIPADLAKPGETVTLRFAEILYPELEEYTATGVNGLLMVENLRTALATDFYTMKEGENVIAPDLTFHGYRYIEITGLDEALPAENVQMRVLSSLDTGASYESSNPLVNQLFANIVNSTTSNYISIPTDCPQRDERMGWTGDAQVYALSGSYVADTYPFMRQWMDTVRADCGPTGLSSQYCPAFVNYDLDNDDVIPHKGQSFGITWNCLVVTIPYNLFMQTGDLAIVRDNIENICTYVDHLNDTPLKYKDANGDKQTDERLTGETGTLCDHLARIPTDGVSLGNAVYIACLDEAAAMLEALGETEKAAEYRETAALAREAWNELFIDAETGMTKNAKGVIQDTQASYATPLRFGIISEENLERALQHYQRTIAEPNLTDSDGLAVPAYSITTGFNATGNVLNALSDHGLNDMAYRLFESTEYASWLYPVTQGATSIWERWNGYTNELGFNGNNSMNSFNHYSFGAVYEWMVAYQLGIRSDAARPGYQHFILQPTAGGSFDYARGSYKSVYGTIESGWTAADGAMVSYDARIPANTSATVYLPVGAVLEGGADYARGTAVHNGAECAVFELPAGAWHFSF